MNNNEIEKRSYTGNVSLRSKEKRQIEGYGIVFNKKIELWDGFFEEVDPAAGEYFRGKNIDVVGCFNHDFNKMLGRSSSGTMTFEIDKTGVKYIIDVANTTAGNDVLESVERGDLKGSSFMFSSKNSEYIEDDEGNITKRIKEFRTVREMGPVVFPYYQDTTVSKRGFEAYKEEKQTPPPPNNTRRDRDRLRIKAAKAKFL